MITALAITGAFGSAIPARRAYAWVRWSRGDASRVDHNGKYERRKAAIDVTEEFANRPWHQGVLCTWDGRTLLLRAENDFDSDGVALADEFSDAVAASIEGGFGPIHVVSAVRF
jgi:hypothetical protein